jgi:hypothetical protein
MRISPLFLLHYQHYIDRFNAGDRETGELGWSSFYRDLSKAGSIRKKKSFNTNSPSASRFKDHQMKYSRSFVSLIAASGRRSMAVAVPPLPQLTTSVQRRSVQYYADFEDKNYPDRSMTTEKVFHL